MVSHKDTSILDTNSTIDYLRCKQIMSISTLMLIHKIDALCITGYCDTDCTVCPNDQRITGGVCVYLVNSLISWSSSKHKVASTSSTNDKFRSLVQVVAKIAWIQKVLAKLHIKQT